MLSYSGNQLPDPQSLKLPGKLHATQRDAEAAGTRLHGARSPALDECASKGPHLGVAPATRPTAGLGRHRLARSTAAAPQMRAAPAAPAVTPSSSRPRASRSATRKPTAQQCSGISAAAPDPARLRVAPPGSSQTCTAGGKPLPRSASGRGVCQHFAPRAPGPTITTQVPPACVPNKGYSRIRRHG